MPLVTQFTKKYFSVEKVYLDAEDYVLVRAFSRSELKEFRDKCKALAGLTEDDPKAEEVDEEFTRFVVGKALVKEDGSPMVEDLSVINDLDLGIVAKIFDGVLIASGLKKKD